MLSKQLPTAGSLQSLGCSVSFYSSLANVQSGLDQRPPLLHVQGVQDGWQPKDRAWLRIPSSAVSNFMSCGSPQQRLNGMFLKMKTKSCSWWAGTLSSGMMAKLMEVLGSGSC